MGTVDVLACSVSEVVHDNGELDGLVGLSEQSLVVIRCQREIVERIEFVKESSIGERLGLVVHQPPGDVPVQVVREGIK